LDHSPFSKNRHGRVCRRHIDPRQRLDPVATGGTVVPAGDELMTIDVAPKRIGLRVGYDIVAAMRKADQPSISIPIGIAL
jgi:hypothetical protein